MRMSAGVLTGIGLLLIGLLQALWQLKLSPWLFHRKSSATLDDRIDAKHRRDMLAAWTSLLLIAALSIWNIRDTTMSDEVARKEFSALEARVAKLEGKGPPGTGDALDKRLGEIEKSLAGAAGNSRGFATREELERTRKELERTIEKVVAEVKALRTSIQQRGQTQGG
jgi:hypothetical protein